jgi:hypothetical protein
LYRLKKFCTIKFTQKAVKIKPFAKIKRYSSFTIWHQNPIEAMIYRHQSLNIETRYNGISKINTSFSLSSRWCEGERESISQILINWIVNDFFLLSHIQHAVAIWIHLP